MIRYPLSTIPNSVVQIMQVCKRKFQTMKTANVFTQAGVTLQRIETFLNEDEVDEQVSSIKRANMNAGSRPTYTEFGLKHATFRWNAVEEKVGEDKSKNKKTRDPAPSNVTDATIVETNDGTSTERAFNLSDISVVFPEGELSVITGPTASGKTALLVTFF